MEYKVHCSPSEEHFTRAVHSLIENHLVQLDRITAKFPVRSLLVSAHRNNGNGFFALKLSLVLENRAQTVHATSPFLESAVSLGFRKLHRQIRMFKDKLRKTNTFEKVRRKKEALPNPEEIELLAADLNSKVAERDFIGFRNQLVGLLPRLQKFVRRELAYHQIAEGGLPGRLELVEDVVEEALLDTFEKFPERPQGLHPEKWIFRHAMDLIGVHVNHAREEILEEDCIEIRPHLTQSMPPKISPESNEEEDQELLDELEDFPLDVVGFEGISAPPAESGNGAQQDPKAMLSYALNRIHPEERKAIFLCFLEGFRPVEAALTMNCSEARIRDLVNSGAQRIKGLLQGNGR